MNQPRELGEEFVFPVLFAYWLLTQLLSQLFLTSS